MPLDQYDVDKEEEYEVKRKDEMSFWEHLEELRGRILKIGLAILVGIIVSFAMGEPFLMSIIQAPIKNGFPTYDWMCNLAEKTGMKSLCITAPNLRLYTRELGEAFFKYMQVALVIGLMGAAPVIFWQIWSFIKPGLMEAEVKAARGFVVICSALFSAGVLFGYFIITPFAVSFLANFTFGGIGGEATLESYVGYLTMFTLPIGLVFELPVVIYFLSKVGIVTPEFLKKYRKHMVVILLVVAGVITPSPDLISQLLVFIPLFTLYEVGIVVSKRVQKQREARAKLDA